MGSVCVGCPQASDDERTSPGSRQGGRRYGRRPGGWNESVQVGWQAEGHGRVAIVVEKRLKECA